MSEVVLQNLRLASFAPDVDGYGLIEAATVIIQDGIVQWLGPSHSVPKTVSTAQAIDLAGALVTPALIDCHTHLIFGGNRAREFEMRLEGASYEDIARAGGGILSTVTHTRQMSETDLVKAALPRLDHFLAEGVGTLEIKSGYGLDIETELRMLRAARRLQAERRIRILTSFLGAHAIPPDYQNRAAAYIEDVVLPALDAAHKEGLVDAVDGFCENIAFSVEEISTVFRHAKRLGLPVKLHAEQLSNQGGAEMAAGFGALSVDHLEYLDQAGVDAMAASGSVAVLLPGAFYTLRETRLPPVKALRKAGVPIAIASDCNPGSSPMTSALLCLNMACTFFRLTPLEALRGMTINAAKALAIEAQVGSLEVGKRAELAVWKAEHPAELCYRIGYNPLQQRLILPAPGNLATDADAVG